jgi:hypothetical protein
LRLIFPFKANDARPGPTRLPEQATEPGRVKRLEQMPYDDPDDEPWRFAAIEIGERAVGLPQLDD